MYFVVNKTEKPQDDRKRNTRKQYQNNNIKIIQLRDSTLNVV